MVGLAQRLKLSHWSRCLAGLLLLAAAGLKAHQLLTVGPTGTDFFSSKIFLACWIPCEVFLGLVLLTGIWRRPAWVAGVAVYAVFSVMTGLRAWRGEADCGCFGVLAVDPRITLSLDLGILLALACFRPVQGESARRGLAMAIGLVALAVGVPLGVAIARFQPTTLGEDGEILGEGGLVVLRPETWTGRRWPLLAHIDAGERLALGRWTAVLYRRDCPHCRDQVPRFLAKPENAKRSDLALIELPSTGPGGEDLAPPDAPFLVAKVSAARQWFVETPTLVELEMGVVRSVSAGEADPYAAELRKLASRTDLAVVQAADGRVDLGPVAAGEHRAVRVRLGNPLGRPFGLVAVRSECRCMTAQVDGQNAIATQDPVSLILLFVAPHTTVAYDQRLLVITDDAKAPIIPLRVTAAVGQSITWSPAEPTTPAMAIGEQATVTVTLRNHTVRPLRLLLSSSSDRSCRVDLPVDPIPPGGAQPLEIVVRCQTTGTKMTFVNITTDADTGEAVRIPVEVRGR